MANTFNTSKNAPGIIAKALAKTLKDELAFTKSISVADNTDYDGKNGFSAGDTIYISKPARFIPQTTFDITSTIQDVKEEKAALALNISSTVGLQLTAQDMQTEAALKSWMKRAIIPAAQSIAQNIEQRYLQNATR